MELEKLQKIGLVNGGVMGFVHGMYSRWCKICCLEAQLGYAKEIAEQIPSLEKELEELKGKE